jgi:hypothetical protein
MNLFKFINHKFVGVTAAITCDRSMAIKIKKLILIIIVTVHDVRVKKNGIK